MLHALAVTTALVSPSFESSIKPLPQPMRQRLVAGGFWKRGCPVPLSGLRLLTVTHRDFRGRSVQGQVVVNKRAAPGLRVVFGKLYGLHFPIRHMRFDDAYGTRGQRPRDGDVSGSFECRQAVPSPCTGGRGTGSWSNHAYGLAIDINPRENPYVGCGMTYNRTTRRYMDRSRHRKGMITRKAIAAFASIGWEWGGAWTGNTKDYMHFSVNGH